VSPSQVSTGKGSSRLYRPGASDRLRACFFSILLWVVNSFGPTRDSSGFDPREFLGTALAVLLNLDIQLISPLPNVGSCGVYKKVVFRIPWFCVRSRLYQLVVPGFGRSMVSLFRGGIATDPLGTSRAARFSIRFLRVVYNRRRQRLFFRPFLFSGPPRVFRSRRPDATHLLEMAVIIVQKLFRFVIGQVFFRLSSPGCNLVFSPLPLRCFSQDAFFACRGGTA